MDFHTARMIFAAACLVFTAACIVAMTRVSVSFRVTVSRPEQEEPAGPWRESLRDDSDD